MLVCTPSPFATESLLGYVLRVSETNGYETPWYALRLAGIRPNQMTTAGFPAEKFAKVLNRNPEALARIAYRSPDSDDGGFRLLGHPLGDGLSIKPLRLSKPAICPDCVTENRYVDAFFDLNLAIACPVHRKMLVHACPACGERLSWFRPGLLTCRCGASLAEIDPVPVSQELGDLMSVLKAKLHGTALSALDLQTTLPGEQLLAMPLRSLLLKLPAFARFNRPGAGDDTLPIMEGAAEALTNWPHGFHRFLENAGESRCPAGTAYRKRFEHVFSTLFKGTSTGKELQWLRDEFVRYGLEHVRDAIIDNKMLRCGVTGRRYVTKKELARRLGVSPVTLRKWADKGLIELKRVEVARQPRYIADANRAEFTPPVAGEGVRLMVAAYASTHKEPAHRKVRGLFCADSKAAGHLGAD